MTPSSPSAISAVPRPMMRPPMRAVIGPETDEVQQKPMANGRNIRPAAKAE